MDKLVFPDDIRYNQTWRDGGNRLKYIYYPVLSGKETDHG